MKKATKSGESIWLLLDLNIHRLLHNGYRSKSGTSIVIKLDPGKSGTTNLKASAEKNICGTRMPGFCNGKRIGLTYLEIMEAAHKYNGENIYEFTDE